MGVDEHYSWPRPNEGALLLFLLFEGKVVLFIPVVYSSALRFGISTL